MRIILILLAFPVFAVAQNSQAGPYIPDFGKVYQIPNPDLETDKTAEYKVLFDVYQKQTNPAKVNRQLNTAARFLNMHGQAGVPLENLKVVCVVHNKAGFDMMDNESYKAKYGVDNPNIKIMEQLTAAGAEIYICGQTAYSRGIDTQKLATPVKMALSAMTAIVTYGNKGYNIIPF
jgi:intracellular sulfur oxidation DsrE/DsrF family protein